MLDELVDKALNAGYGEIVASLVAAMSVVIGYYVVRHIKRYDKVYEAVYGKKGLHNSVSVINERLDSQDDKIEQVVDSIKALVNDVIAIKIDYSATQEGIKYIKEWVAEQKNKN